MGEGTGIFGEALLHQFGMGDEAEPLVFHMLTHALVFCAYALIAGTLIWQIRRNKKLLRLKMVRIVIVLASLAGLAHLAGLLSVGMPHPRLDAVVHLLSAAFGLCGAILLWYWLPQMLAMAQERRLTPVNMVSRADFQALQAKLDRTHEGLQRFAAAASHDLRAPLRHISVFAGLIEREEGDQLTPAGRDYLERLNTSVTRMQSLTDALVEYVRAISATHAPSRLELRDSLASVRKDLELDIESHKAVIEVAPMPSVWGDEQLVSMVLHNLVENALKFSKDPPVIRVYARDAKDGWVEIVIEDEGPGIDPRQSEMIFDVLFRMSSGPVEGVGLGLALCQQIVEAAGGRIWHDPDYDAGARFVFTLPAAP
ncbi:ATP-binding protein [Oceanicaulis alexandrii]|uniref:sensor histidine kinase n=1 Tax=Oceanicaulis alexandrii TaxID=153233 RepID=UPI0035CEBFB4